MAGVPLADIALGPDGKLLVENGRFVIITDHDARKQCIRIALLHFMGEWYRDENAGTDYRGAVLGKATDMARRAELRRRILSVPGVSDVRSMKFKSDRVTRSMEVSVEAIASDGAVLAVSVVVAGGG